MENYSGKPKSFIRWKNTSFREAISTANRGAGTFMASDPVKYANASTQIATDTNPKQKSPASTLTESKPEPDVLTPIRQPRLPNGPGFAPCTRAPKIMKKIFYTDPKTNRSLSKWEPGASELCVYKVVKPELSIEDPKDADDRKSWRDEIVYLNQIRQIRRVNKMCNAKSLKASSDIERHENMYLDQIKQIRYVRELCSTEASSCVERQEDMFLAQIKQIRRVGKVVAKA